MIEEAVTSGSNVILADLSAEVAVQVLCDTVLSKQRNGITHVRFQLDYSTKQLSASRSKSNHADVRQVKRALYEALKSLHTLFYEDVKSGAIHVFIEAQETNAKTINGAVSESRSEDVRHSSGHARVAKQRNSLSTSWMTVDSIVKEFVSDRPSNDLEASCLQIPNKLTTGETLRLLAERVGDAVRNGEQHVLVLLSSRRATSVHSSSVLDWLRQQSNVSFVVNIANRNVIHVLPRCEAMREVRQAKVLLRKLDVPCDANSVAKSSSRVTRRQTAALKNKFAANHATSPSALVRRNLRLASNKWYFKTLLLVVLLLLSSVAAYFAMPTVFTFVE